MIRDAEIREFVDSLAKADTPDDQSYNIYKNVVRCANLIRWFRTFEDTSQSALFVGAKRRGEDGGAITGIPFVSPNVLTSARSVDYWGLSNAGYQVPGKADATQRERTADAVLEATCGFEAC